MSLFPAVEVCGKRTFCSVKILPVTEKHSANMVLVQVRVPVKGGAVGDMMSLSVVGRSGAGGRAIGGGFYLERLFRRTFSRWPWSIAAD